MSVITVYLAEIYYRVDTSVQPFTVFIKLTLADELCYDILKSGITLLLRTKDDLKIVTYSYVCWDTLN